MNLEVRMRYVIQTQKSVYLKLGGVKYKIRELYTPYPHMFYETTFDLTSHS